MLKPIKKLLKNELFCYCIVGGGAVFCDFMIYYILTQYFSVNPSLAKKYSFISGGIWSFLANKFFTFKRKDPSIQELVLFIMVYAMGFILNSVVHNFILKSTQIISLAFISATVISVLWNYLGQKLLVFKVKKSTI